MTWKLVDEAYYQSFFGKSQSIFHSSQFNTLNANNAENIYYLLSEVENNCFGIIFGVRNQGLFSPFSSPFGGIESTKNTPPSKPTELIRSLIKFCADLDVKKIQVTLPPTQYFRSGNFIGAENYLKGGFHEMYTDQSYHLDLNRQDNFQSGLKRNARKNLNKGLSSDHQFNICDSLIEQMEAYQVIQQNRSERGYPLKLSFDQLQHTGSVVPIRYFSLDIEQEPAAASVVYEVTDEIVMVVYWGHLSSAEAFRPINLLSFYLYEHFKQKGFKILDIGPSSERGVLNEGLANFKLSLGCEVTEKPTVYYEY